MTEFIDISNIKTISHLQHTLKDISIKSIKNYLESFENKYIYDFDEHSVCIHDWGKNYFIELMEYALDNTPCDYYEYVIKTSGAGFKEKKYTGNTKSIYYAYDDWEDDWEDKIDELTYMFDEEDNYYFGLTLTPKFYQEGEEVLSRKVYFKSDGTLAINRDRFKNLDYGSDYNSDSSNDSDDE